jgi:hypothetical protein
LCFTGLVFFENGEKILNNRRHQAQQVPRALEGAGRADFDALVADSCHYQGSNAFASFRRLFVVFLTISRNVAYRQR